jgi:hypothetical protein
MVPDRGFTKQLKALDPNLEVVWDWGAGKWEIWCFPENTDAYHVTTVQTKGRSYRELGADVLLKLQMNMKLGPDAILKYLEECDEQIRRRKQEEFREKIQSIAIDTFWNVNTKFLQVPKEYLINPTGAGKLREVV